MNKMILTAGPSITKREIAYVTDAVTNGIDEYWGDYIKRFEKAFADYIGIKYALSTSSCTGALHLALTALGIKRGDEVLVPDLSWIATASAVCYTGAKPVFVDVMPYSWGIDPIDLETKITKRTKAIIPVHLYGHPCDMGVIMNLAMAYGLKVVEDAAPSVGSTFNGQKTGSFGDLAGFSFQGAKMVSTGEGGMVVTNDQGLFEKVKHYAEHGRTSCGFEISSIGFKYKMSNLQAALGLAQIERVDELVKRKKEIYDSYCNHLEDIPGLILNQPPDNFSQPNYWMTSIVMEKRFRVTRDHLMARLKERNIDTRPFFPPMSSFKMFKNAYNPVAQWLGDNGINLPSGHRITEEDIKYVCDNIKSILQV